MRRGPILAAAGLSLLLTACGPGAPGPDAAELRETWGPNYVPRSSAAAFVGVFDSVCSEAAADARELRARQLGYVPAQAPREGGAARLFVVDDRRPALRLGTRLCMVEAISRTGQTQRVRDYVGAAHSDAQPVGAPPTGQQVEQMWLLPEGGLIATRRWRDGENLIRYALIRFTEAT
jgi:hypothetical protein